MLAAVAGWVASLDTSVNIALPAITKAFSLGVGDISWVVVGYVLTYASLLLGAGRLADRVGHWRVLVGGLALSAVAFALCGLAPLYPALIGARVVQGVGAGLVLAAAPALVTLSVAPELRSRALGLFQLSASIGFAMGAPVGGLLLGPWGWRAIWWYRLPLAVVVLVLVLVKAPRGALARKTERDGLPMDGGGIALLAVGLAGVLLAATRGRNLGWVSPLVLASVAFGALAMVAFVRWERRAPNPVVDLRLFRRPGFALANGLNLMATAAGFPILLIVPYYLVNVRELGPVAGGVVLGMTPLGTAVAAPRAGRLAESMSLGRLAAAGLALEAAGLGVVAALSSSSPLVVVAMALLVTGLGQGLFQVPNQSFVMGSIPREAQGVAAGVTQAVRTIGVLGGVAAGGTLLEARQSAHAARLGVALDDVGSFLAAFGEVFAVAAVLAAVGAVLALVRSRSEALPSSA